MPVFTRDQLVRETLGELGIADANNPVEAEDFAIANDAVVPAFQEFAALGLYEAGDYDRIEAAVFNPLAVLLALRIAGKFGVSGTELTLLKDRASAAEKRLVILNSSGPTYEIMRGTYF